MANGIQAQKFTSTYVPEMGFCSINHYISAVKSESFDALLILFTRVIFVHIVIEIEPGPN